MASDFIAIDPGDAARVQKILSEAPESVQDEALESVADYLIEVLRQYPTRKHVSRTQAYGRPFQSDRQRRKVFALLADGKIPYRRTQGLRRAWKKIGRGRDVLVVNESPHAALVMGDGEQAAQMRLIGWKTTTTVTEERRDRIDRVTEGAAEKAMRKLAR